MVLPTATVTAVPLSAAMPPTVVNEVVLFNPPVVTPIVALSVAELVPLHTFVHCKVAVLRVLVTVQFVAVAGTTKSPVPPMVTLLSQAKVAVY